MAKIFLRDVGSHPERDLEVTLFKDGELQFEADNGKYVHINIARAGVKELIEFLLEETRPAKNVADWKIPSPEYGATSNCIVCNRRIVFCGDGVWLHCQPQDHGHARPNGAIVNPPKA